MRNLALCLAVVLAVAPGFAEKPPDLAPLPFDPESGVVRYRDIVEVPGIPADKIHAAVIEWIARTYRSSKDVIQLDTPGKVLARGVVETTYRLGHYLAQHDVMIEIQDGRARVTIDRITITHVESTLIVDRPIETGSGVMGMKSWVKSMREGFNSALLGILESAKAAIRASAAPPEKW